MLLSSGQIDRLSITVRGDFPWASTKWEDVSESIRSAGLSATGKRAVFESRGEIFTVPAEKGSPRNLTETSGTADRAPVWSPSSDDLAWFSDDGIHQVDKLRRTSSSETALDCPTSWLSRSLANLQTQGVRAGS